MTRFSIWLIVVSTFIMAVAILFFPEYDIVVSFGIRIIAMIVAMYFAIQFKEWRLLPLAAMFLLMAFRQAMTFLIWCKVMDNSAYVKSLSELPGNIVTLLGLSSICYLGYLISQKNKVIHTQSCQINQLKDLLPICSKCKKVRNDDGYWQQIDSYIEQHTDTEFSHGLCDDCMKELYGKEPWFKDKKKK